MKQREQMMIHKFKLSAMDALDRQANVMKETDWHAGIVTDFSYVPPPQAIRMQ